jgi:hypothetical protein
MRVNGTGTSAPVKSVEQASVPLHTNPSEVAARQVDPVSLSPQAQLVPSAGERIQRLLLRVPVLKDLVKASGSKLAANPQGAKKT